MKLVIVAATGGIGQHLLDQAVAAGHDVTAVVRTPDRLSLPVPAVQADLSHPDPGALATAFAGADAILSTLGPRQRTQAEVVVTGTRGIIQAMRDTGVRRILAVSAAPVATVPSPGRPQPPRHDPRDGLLVGRVLYPVLKRVFREQYAALARMEDDLRDSGLDWTSVRPPRLTNGPCTGHYRIGYGHNAGRSISRADAAHAMLRLVTDERTFAQPAGIGY